MLEMEMCGVTKISTDSKKDYPSLLPQLKEPEFFPDCWKNLLSGLLLKISLVLLCLPIILNVIFRCCSLCGLSHRF